MRKLFLVTMAVLLIVSLSFVGCVPAPVVAPKVTVEHWEPAFYLPWAALELPPGLKAALPRLLPGVPSKNEGVIAIYYVAAIENPNDYEVMLKELNFSVFFKDAITGHYFDAGYTPHTLESMWIPAKKTNYVRMTHFLYSRALATALIATYGPKLPVVAGVPDTESILKGWWADVAGVKLAMKIEGQAFFTSPAGDVTSIFTATFPK